MYFPENIWKWLTVKLKKQIFGCLGLKCSIKSKSTGINNFWRSRRQNFEIWHLFILLYLNEFSKNVWCLHTMRESFSIEYTKNLNDAVFMHENRKYGIKYCQECMSYTRIHQFNFRPESFKEFSRVFTIILAVYFPFH